MQKIEESTAWDWQSYACYPNHLWSIKILSIRIEFLQNTSTASELSCQTSIRSKSWTSAQSNQLSMTDTWIHLFSEFRAGASVKCNIDTNNTCESLHMIVVDTPEDVLNFQIEGHIEIQIWLFSPSSDDHLCLSCTWWYNQLSPHRSLILRLADTETTHRLSLL